jgi:hypothetical protein
MCIVYVSLFWECYHQYSPVVWFLRKRNPIVASENPTSGAADWAPCADSNFSLKEMIVRLNNMDLIEGKGNYNQTCR